MITILIVAVVLVIYSAPEIKKYLDNKDIDCPL